MTAEEWKTTSIQREITIEESLQALEESANAILAEIRCIRAGAPALAAPRPLAPCRTDSLCNTTGWGDPTL